jgi:NAD(P)-dependent dehydrogenase (short-subunit alcohol dehydrogenase family)
MADLRDHRVLITGGSSGVGLAAAQAFQAEGAEVAVIARRATRVPGVIALRADVGDRKAIERAVTSAIERLGGLDVLVVNAAAAAYGHFLELHPDDFDRVIQVTLLGVVNVVRAALPTLRQSRGTIVATGSLNSRVPLPGWGSYAAAKHGLRGFLNTLAVEEREHGSGVRVAMVHPGPIDTPLFGAASSATGRTPRVPPDAYGSDVVARALVAAAGEPRRETLLGGETRAFDLAFSAARPVAETMLLLIDRFTRSGSEPAPQPGSLWEPPDSRGEMSGGIPARDSLYAPLQLGRRLLPSPATPVRVARHLVRFAGQVARDPRSVLQASAEREPPPRSLRETADAPATPDRAGRS